MIPLPVSTHPVAAIQQRSAVQRRTQPRKLEGENPNGFRSQTTSKPGSKSGATGFRGREGGAGALGIKCSAPHPFPSLYRCPRGPLEDLKRGGILPGLLPLWENFPLGLLPCEES